MTICKGVNSGTEWLNAQLKIIQPVSDGITFFMLLPTTNKHSYSHA